MRNLFVPVDLRKHLEIIAIELAYACAEMDALDVNETETTRARRHLNRAFKLLDALLHRSKGQSRESQKAI
jgi:hypothetical protein